MLTLTTPGWNDYKLIDSGDGYRLEQFGSVTVARPDPQILWQKHNKDQWESINARFVRTQEDKGIWEKNIPIPEKWLMSYKDIFFYSKLTPFKHVGVFPEQAPLWDWISEKILSSQSQVRLLNLFAYTGISSLFATKAGAHVTHVDASKNTIAWAKENQLASHLPSDTIRWILDDALTFVKREHTRGNQYDAIIMDPPIYGHGPNGETWDFMKSFPLLLKTCFELLSKTPVLFLVNAYAISASNIMLKNALQDYFTYGYIDSGELSVQESSSSRILSTGIFARWSMMA